MFSTEASAQATLQRMKDGHWIDEFTRAVFIEFLIYNPNTNIYGVMMSLFEFTEDGGNHLTPVVRSIPSSGSRISHRSGCQCPTRWLFGKQLYVKKWEDSDPQVGVRTSTIVATVNCHGFLGQQTILWNHKFPMKFCLVLSYIPGSCDLKCCTVKCCSHCATSLKA